tara:strand:- start:1430 stop:1639 length:210 start_codon:yes stop_codon:yes gene_type:complete
MEHIFHIFGGGCGEHMIWPWLASASVAATSVGCWLKAQSIDQTNNTLTDNAPPTLDMGTTSQERPSLLP